MANHSTITIDTKTAEKLLADIESMRKSLEVLRKRVIKLLPEKYGSDSWWKKEIEEAENEFKKDGKSICFDSPQEAIKWLNS